MRTLVSLLLMLVPAVASAQWIPTRTQAITRWEASVFGGYRWGGSFDLREEPGSASILSVDIGDGSVLGFSIAAPVGADYHVELFSSRQKTAVQGAGTGGGVQVSGDIDITYLQLQAVRTWFHPNGLSTHLGFGGGVTRFDPSLTGFSSSDRFSLSITAGAEFDLLRHLAARFDTRIFWTVDDAPLERGGDVPAVLDPGRLGQVEATLGLVARW